MSRLALVIGSQCADGPRLAFIEPLARDLHAALREKGYWQDVPGLPGPLLNPTVGEIRRSVQTAFSAASSSDARLLLAFIGHGIAPDTRSDQFVLLGSDSPRGGRVLGNSYDIAYEIGNLLLDDQPNGLVVYIDACESGHGVREALEKWPNRIGDGNRFEYLAASGDGAAYNGCFTNSVLSTFAAGTSRGGSDLRCGDLSGPAKALCPVQTPQHAIHGGQDEGLWLVPNVAHKSDAVAGRPAAGLVDQLTRNVVVTASLAAVLDAVVGQDAARVRVLTGPAGSGKSTALALLIRPTMANTTVIDSDYINAAVFLDANSTVLSVAQELSASLRDRVPGFHQALRRYEPLLADRDGPSTFELTVLRPLADVSATGRVVRLLVDGVDQPRAMSACSCRRSGSWPIPQSWSMFG